MCMKFNNYCCSTSMTKRLLSKLRDLRQGNTIGNLTSESWFSVVFAYSYPSKKKKATHVTLETHKVCTIVGVYLSIVLNDIHEVLSDCYTITLTLVPQKDKPSPAQLVEPQTGHRTYVFVVLWRNLFVVLKSCAVPDTL